MAPAGEASVTWRVIEYGLELLKQGAIRRIGNGESTRIWRGNWIPRTPNMKPSGPTKVCRLRRVSQLLRHGSNEWDEGLPRRYLFPWDVDEVLKIKVPWNKGSDCVAWQYEKSRIFSVRSAYRLALNIAQDLDAIGSSSSANGERGVWKKLWNLPALPRIRNFVWKLTQNGLPSNANRCFMHISADASCELCSERLEDCFHAVMGCPHAVALRNAMREHWCMPPEDRLRNNGPEWFLAVLESSSKEEASNLAMVLWHSWTVRNKVTRAGEALSIDVSVLYLTNLGKNLVDMRSGENAAACAGTDQNAGDNKGSTRTAAQWCPPGQDVLKVNVDAAFNNHTREAAVGVIV
jgi:hypothetical protein